MSALHAAGEPHVTALPHFHHHHHLCRHHLPPPALAPLIHTCMYANDICLHMVQTIPQVLEGKESKFMELLQIRLLDSLPQLRVAPPGSWAPTPPEAPPQQQAAAAAVLARNDVVLWLPQKTMMVSVGGGALCSRCGAGWGRGGEAGMPVCVAKGGGREEDVCGRVGRGGDNIRRQRPCRQSSRCVAQTPEDVA